MDTEELPQNNPSPDSPAPLDRDWPSMYSAERKRSRILGATTVAASLLAVGAGAWGLTQADSSAGTAGPGQFGGPGPTSQFTPPGTGQSGTTAVPGGPGAGMPGQDLAASLFNSDGSVNSSALQQFLSAMPGGGANLEAFLGTAVQQGDLTSDQADQLLAASGTSTGSSDSGAGTGSSDTEGI